MRLGSLVGIAGPLPRLWSRIGLVFCDDLRLCQDGLQLFETIQAIHPPILYHVRTLASSLQDLGLPKYRSEDTEGMGRRAKSIKMIFAPFPTRGYNAQL